MVMAGVRLEAWALWCELSAIARLLVAWTAQSPLCATPDLEDVDRDLARRLAREVAAQDRHNLRGPSDADMAADFASSELSARCGMTRVLADRRVHAAQLLVVERRLPRVAMLLRAGLLDRAKIELLVSRLGVLEPLVADCVEERLIPDREIPVLADLAHAPDLIEPDDGVFAAPPPCAPAGSAGRLAAVPSAPPGTHGRLSGWTELDLLADPAAPGAVLPAITRMTLPALRKAIDDALAAIDPDALKDRADRARRERDVWSQPDEQGTARIVAKGEVEAVQGVMNDLNAVAAAAKAAGDPRTRSQIRTDEFFYRLSHGAYGAPASSPEREGADSAHGDDGAAGDGGGGSTCTSCGSHSGTTARRARRGLHVSLTMTLGTWLGLHKDPAVLEGHTLAGSIAQRIAEDAARDRPGSTTWRCVIVDDEHGTVLGVGRPLSTPRHDPPAPLADLVRTIHPTCVFPGCTVASRSCDIDHRLAYERGGPTCSCNLFPLCRTHHRLKGTGLIAVSPTGSSRAHAPTSDAGAWSDHGSGTSPAEGRWQEAAASRLDDELARLDADEPKPPLGSLIWRLRSGATYLRVPPPATPAALAESMDDVPRHVTQERLADGAALRRVNARLAAEADRRRRDRALQEQAELERERLAEQRWVDAVGHAPDDLELTPPPPVPADLAALWGRGQRSPRARSGDSTQSAT